MARYVFIFLPVFFFLSCGDNSDQQNSNDSAANAVTPTTSVTPTPVQPPQDTTDPDNTRVAKDGNVPPQTGEGNVRFMVSFISKGEGIDKKSKSDFDRWLAGRKDITYNLSPWGREGEVSYCFPLSNLSTQEQEAFVRDVRNYLTNRDLIYFSENVACEKRR